MVLTVPSSSRSRASIRPPRSSQTPPEQRPGIRATCPKGPPATCQTLVPVSPAARAKAPDPSGDGGSRDTRKPSPSGSTEPSGSSPVRGPAAAPPVGYSSAKACRSATRRWIRTRPSASARTSLSASSGWASGSGTAYGSGPARVQRSG